MITLHAGDNRDTLRRLIDQGVRVHAVVCDPPYGLTSITKRFGKAGAAPAKFGTDGAFARASGGFMGNQWDASGIERDPAFWALVWEILLPGGYCLAFSSPRTGHWQACAMEMAGFVMHPFLGWVYGQGFPKDHDAAMAIDKALGQPGHKNATGKPVKRLIPGADQHATGSWIKDNGREYQPGTYVPGTPEGEQWNGWAYGAQALKPALEPIYVGQKPFAEANGALNLIKHGVGAINIDGCRVAYQGEADQASAKPGGKVTSGNLAGGGVEAERKEFAWSQPLGRHPANLLHDGSPEVVAMFPAQAGALAPVTRRGADKERHTYGSYGGNTDEAASTFQGDSGTAARFFNAFPMTEADYAELAAAEIVVDLDAQVIRYQGKATKADRAGSKHPTVKPIALMQWLCRLVTPPGGTVLDPFAGSGTTGAAALAEGFDAILMEADPQYISDIQRRFNLADELDALLGIDEAANDASLDAYDLIG